MIPPTRVTAVQTSGAVVNSTPTLARTVQLDVMAGDLLVVNVLVNGFNPSATPVASGGSVVWTSGFTTRTGRASWTGAVGATATGVTISITLPGATSRWGFEATLFRNHGGVGLTAGGGSFGVPTLTFTFSANSAVVCELIDTNGTAGTRTWATVNGSAMTESWALTDSAGNINRGGYRADVGAAGSKTVGMTAPTGQTYSVAAVEVLGTIPPAAAPRNAIVAAESRRLTITAESRVAVVAAEPRVAIPVT